MSGQGAFGRYLCLKPVGPGARFGQTCGKQATHYLPPLGGTAPATVQLALGYCTTWCAEHVKQDRPSDRGQWVRIPE